MRHTIVTYTVKPGREEENAALVRAVFAELARERPAGFRYAVFELPGTRQFVHLYTDEGSPAGLGALSSFQAFVADAKDRHEQPATVAKAKLIGDYGTFADPSRPAPADTREASDAESGAHAPARGGTPPNPTSSPSTSR